MLPTVSKAYDADFKIMFKTALMYTHITQLTKNKSTFKLKSV